MGYPVDHRHIHADVTYILCLLTVHQTVATAVAKSTVESVGITDRNSGNHGVAFDLALTAIAHRLTSRHIAHLKDRGLQRRNSREDAVVTRIDAIESDAKAAHIHLSLREMLDAGRVVHVTEDLVREGCLQLLTALLEERKLTGRELIEPIAVGTHEMTEYGARDDGRLMLQAVNQLEHILFRIEAQAMHTRIQLDMHWPTRDTLLTCRLDECIQQTEGIDLWFQIVVEHRLESRHLRVHHHDIGGDACLTERHALIGHCHSQIIDALILQCLGYLHSTCTIGICLDHAHHLRVGMEERAEVVQIIDHRIQIHLKDGLVNFLLQLFRDEVEAKRTGTLQKRSTGNGAHWRRTAYRRSESYQPAPSVRYRYR